jgi:hypothetical protein
MRLEPIVRDFPGFLDELVAALESDETIVYLDTSLLMWLLRLEPEVRAEFVAWCDERPKGSVRIPVWVAHELHRLLDERREFKNVQSAIAKIRGLGDALGELAAERAGEGLCRRSGYTGRDAFVGDVEATLERVTRFVKTISLDDEDYRSAAQEVVAFVNERVLETNLARITRELSTTGRFRREHRIPPGFKDDKNENPQGDVIIWEEIVEDLHAAGPLPDGGPRRAIFITRDEKQDWISKSTHVQLEPGKSRSAESARRIEVKRPHPLLVHDLAVRANGAQVYITHPAFLAGVLLKLGKKRGGGAPAQWWRASYRHALWMQLENDTAWAIENTQRGGAGTKQGEGSPAASPPSVPARSEPGLAKRGGRGALAPLVVNRSALHGGQVPEHVAAYLAALPGTEASVVEGWITAAEEGRMDLFTLGGTFAQMIVQGAADWPAQVPALLGTLRERFRLDDVNKIVLALIGRTYFDSAGELRTRPVTALGELIMPLEADDDYRPAFQALNRFLAEADAKLVYMPGTARTPVVLEVEFARRSGREQRNVHSIRLNSYQALADDLPAESPRRFSALLRRAPADGMLPEELRALLAREYLIPIDLVKPSTDLSKITWTSDQGLFGMDTGVEGGLSTVANEEEIDD